MFAVPSPKKQSVTSFSSRYLLPNATPAAIGTWPPTIAQPPKKRLRASKRCIEPPRPPLQPVARPKSSAIAPRASPVRAVGRDDVVRRLGRRDGAHRDRLLADVEVEEAAHLPLRVGLRRRFLEA